MKRFILFLACLLPAAMCQAQGHASATWVLEKKHIVGGEPVRTAIRVKVDEGWHTYWKNPGEVGIPFTLATDFPEGWEAGEIQYPAPERIAVSGLVSFCHEGKFLLPVTVTPPSGFIGEVPELHATLKWLACNVDSCVPGKAELTASAESGSGSVADAYSNLPAPIAGSSLSAAVDDGVVSLTLTLPENADVDPTACEVFPVTRNIIDPAATIHFRKSPEAPNTWQASAPKDEYFPEETGEISMLLVAADKRVFVVTTQ